MTVTYKLTFPNGKSYIGVSDNLEARLKQHVQNSSAVGNAIRKYGGCVCEVLFEGERSDCFEKEVEFIASLETLYPKGYNLSLGGDRVGHTPEILKKLSDAAQRQYSTAEARQKTSEGQRRRWSDPRAREEQARRAAIQFSDPIAKSNLLSQLAEARAKRLGRSA